MAAPAHPIQKALAPPAHRTPAHAVARLRRRANGAHMAAFVFTCAALLFAGGVRYPAHGTAPALRPLFTGGLFADAAPHSISVAMLLSEVTNPCEPEAAVLAVERINNNATLLPGIELQYRRLDTEKEPWVATFTALTALCATNSSRRGTDALDVNPPACRSADVIFGAAYSVCATPVQYVARMYDVVQLSHSAETSALDTDAQAPTFSRTYHSATYSGSVAEKLVDSFGWTSAVIVHQKDVFINDYADAFTQAFHRRSADIGASLVLSESPTDEELERVAIVLKATRVFVAVIFVDDMDLVMRLMRIGREAGLFGKHWAVVLYSYDVRRAWQSGTLTTEQSNTLEGALILVDEGLQTHSPEYAALHQQWVARPGDTRCLSANPTFYATHAYDSMMFLGQALHDLFSDPQAPWSYDKVDYSAFPPREAVQSQLRATRMRGATGLIELDLDGNRITPFTVVNIQGAGAAPVIATFVPDKSAALAEAAARGRFDFDERVAVVWPGGLSTVPFGEGQPWELPSGTGVALEVLNAITLAIGLLVVAAVAKHRSSELLSWSGRKALFCLLLGPPMAAAAASVDRRGMENSMSLDAFNGEHCTQTDVTVILSWLFIQAGLLSKARRFYWAKGMPQLHVVPPRPTHFTRTFASLSVFSLCWVFVALLARPEGLDGAVESRIVDTQRNKDFVFIACDSVGITPWHSLFFALAAVVEAYGAALAFRARTMPAGLFEARYVAACYLGVVVARVLALPATLLEFTTPDVALATRVVSTLLPAWMCLVLMCTRVYGIYMKAEVNYLVRVGAGAANPAVSVSVRRVSNPLTITLSSAPPKSWAPQTANCMVVPLATDDPEFVAAAESLWASLPTMHVLRVERLQNMYLWQRFAQERTRLAARNGEAGVNERLLWHGTGGLDPTVVYDGLETAGFDVRMAADKGNFYGRGMYFAERVAYVDSAYTYDPPGEPGVRQVLLARVLTGHSKNYGKTKRKDLKRPPPRPDRHGELYDSVHGGPHTGAVLRDEWRATIMYIVYNSAQAYPAFKVTYKPMAAKVPSLGQRIRRASTRPASLTVAATTPTPTPMGSSATPASPPGGRASGTAMSPVLGPAAGPTSPREGHGGLLPPALRSLGAPRLERVAGAGASSASGSAATT